MRPTGGMFVVLVGALVWSGAASGASLSCQSAAVTAFGPSQPRANAQWEARVDAEFGKAWGALGNARGYKVRRDSILPSPNAIQVSAIPCAALPPAQRPNANRPGQP